MSSGACIYKYSRATKDKEKGEKCGAKVNSSGVYCAKHKKIMNGKAQKTLKNVNPSNFEVNDEDLIAEEEIDKFNHPIFVNWDQSSEGTRARKELLQRLHANHSENKNEESDVDVENEAEKIIEEINLEQELPKKDYAKEYFNQARQNGISARDVAKIGAFSLAGMAEKTFALKDYQKELFNDKDFNLYFNQWVEDVFSEQVLFGPGQSCLIVAGTKFITCSTPQTPIVGGIGTQLRRIKSNYLQTAVVQQPPNILRKRKPDMPKEKIYESPPEQDSEDDEPDYDQPDISDLMDDSSASEIESESDSEPIRKKQKIIGY